MKKRYLVPFALAGFTAAAYAQTASGGAGEPGMTGNPGLNNQQSDDRNQPNAPGRPRGTMNNGPISNGVGNSGPSSGMSGSAPADSMPNTTQSVAPGSAPQGSNMPQMAKPKPRNADGSEPSARP